MSGYGTPSVVSAPRLDENKALENILYVLQHVDNGELDELLNNEEQLNNIIRDSEEVKKIEVQRQMLMASNKSLAEFNLSMEPQMASKRQMLIDSHENRAVILVEFAKNREKLESASKEYSPDTTLALLQTATAQSEEEAEKTVDNFLEGQINVEDFVQTFYSQKTTHHLRRIKTEKMAELLHKRAPSQFSYRY